MFQSLTLGEGGGETGATYIWARFFILNELDCEFL